jgi:Tol biopolymer transport system component
VLAAGLAAVLLAIAAGAWLWTRDVGKAAAPPSITRLTTTGQVRHAAISPDGKYVAYVAFDDDGQSLWVRDLTSTSRIEVVPAARWNYRGMTFSPDSASLYYVVAEQDRPREGALYKAAALGGTAPPVRLLVGIDTPVTFSPDATRIAYIVSDQMAGRSALMIADAGGGGAYALATRTMPEEFVWATAGPAWAPRGTSIITAGVSTEGGRQASGLVEVQTRDGSQTPLGTRRFAQVGRIGWMKDGNSFIVAASDRLGANQLWEVLYPSGDVRQITDDGTKDYRGVSMNAEATVLATVQHDRQAHLWVAEAAAAEQARQITAGKYDGNYGLAWTADGRIVYHSLESGTEDLWLMNLDGSGRRQLTADPAVDEDPFVSADGRHVVFSSNRSGTFNIWRLDVNGGSGTRLTTGHGDQSPVVTADGRWVIYESSTSGTPTLWRVAMHGGQATQLTRLASTNPTLSPDGTRVAFRYRDDPLTDGKLGVLRLSDGALVHEFALAAGVSRELQWTPEGITYVRTTAGVSNIWTQSLSGEPPRQLTQFTSGRIVQYEWSATGRNLVYARGSVNNDVVLVRLGR